ncbi:MAG TPA: transporter, partial [Lachnospiraceae bacterium]|nr:transporter [Lachnospiraceae bacterium]
MRRKFIIAVLALLVLLFVIFPDIASNGAENGLMLWFNVIIPSLCPFMIISSMLIKLNVTSFISNMFYPV